MEPLTQGYENQVLQYLGHRGGAVPAEVRESIARAWEEARAAARPRHVWRAFPLEEGRRPAGTSLAFRGGDILALLEGCDQVVLMAATLGPEVDRLLMQAQAVDMARAVLLDACASSAMEQVCDQLEEELRRELEAGGRHLTDRFSPGYGDLPVEQQGELCRVLDTQRRIGLTVTQRSLLLPRKSVTAVLGAADTPRPHRGRGCAWCSLFETCAYRREGKCCGA